MKPSVCCLAATLLAIASASAQQKFTAADYARAEQLMGYNTTPLVLRSGVRPNWLPDERFWYRVTTAEGAEFVLVDPAKGTRAPAFDHARLAAALSTATGRAYTAGNLPFQEIEFSSDGQSVSVQAGGRWKCDVKGATCTAEEGATPAAGRGGRGGRGGAGGATAAEVLSPDKKHAAFIRDSNLWVRDAATNQEKALTTDGIKDFGYATDNAGWAASLRPIVLWSPDSKRIATFQQDQRGVGEMYLVETKVGHPTLQAWKYPLPGDQVVTTIQRVTIDLDGPRVVRLNLPPDQHRSTLCDNVACRGGEWADVQWDKEGSQLAFVSTSRDHKQEVLRIADATTGAVRGVLEEKVPTFFESGNGRVNWRYLPESSEVIWFSERDNWGHLYLYDSQTGKLKNQITRGEWNVTQLLRVDEKNRLLYFLGVGREKGRDPYFIHFYRIGFDGANLALLTPEDANHEVTLSASGKYFVDSFSQPDVPSVAVLRDDAGKLLTPLTDSQFRRRHELRQSGQPTVRQKPEGPPAVGPRHHGQQRAALQHPAGGQRTNQGE